MRKLIGALYSALAYVLFLGVFAYFIGFAENLVVPKTIDSGAPGSLPTAVLVNVGLLALFAVQHSVMARRGFKRWWTRIVPEEVERSTFVLFASALVALLCWQWRPLPQPMWSVDEPVAVGALLAVSWSGWALVLFSTFLISHFHLFGLTQGFARLLGRTAPAAEGAFVTPLVYRWVRHPLYLGFVLALWAAPVMSLGHLLLAAGATGYIFVGIWFEERDLVAHFGDRYREYRATVGMLVPKLRLAAGRKPATR